MSNVLQMLYPCVDDSGEMEGAVVGTDHAVLCGGGWAGGVCAYICIIIVSFMCHV